MKGVIKISNGDWVVAYTKKKRGGVSIAPYSYVKIDCESKILGRQYNLCVEGKIVEFEFYGSKKNPYALITNVPIDIKLDKAIKNWCITDGTNTLNLTKEILSIISKNNSKFLTKTKAMKALKHVRDECMDEDLSGNITDQMLKTWLNKL